MVPRLLLGRIFCVALTVVLLLLLLLLSKCGSSASPLRCDSVVVVSDKPQCVVFTKSSSFKKVSDFFLFPLARRHVSFFMLTLKSTTISVKRSRKRFGVWNHYSAAFCPSWLKWTTITPSKCDYVWQMYYDTEYIIVFFLLYCIISYVDIQSYGVGLMCHEAFC